MQLIRKAILLLVLMITMSVSAASPAFANGGGRNTPRPKPVFNVELCHEGGTISVNLFNFFELLRHLCHGDKVGPCAAPPNEEQ